MYFNITNILFYVARGLHVCISINNVITRVATTIIPKYEKYNKLKMKDPPIQENDTSKMIEGTLKGEIGQEIKDNQEKQLTTIKYIKSMILWKYQKYYRYKTAPTTIKRDR